MSWTNGPTSDYPKPINLWSRASHWSSVFCTAARGVRVQLVRNRRVGSRRVDHPYHIRGLKWRRAELAGPTLNNQTSVVPSWLVRLEQSNQRWLKTCRAGWSDLNNQTSVDRRRVELAGPTWTIKMKWSIHVSLETYFNAFSLVLLEKKKKPFSSVINMSLLCN